MPKKKKEETTDGASKAKSQDNDIQISGTVGATTISGAKSTTEVKEISLNQKVESFFGIGSIWLTHENYTAKIPGNLTSQQIEILQQGLDRGLIVEGNVYIPPIDKNPEVLEEYWHLVKTYGIDTNDEKAISTKAFRKLFRNGVDRNWTAKEIANHCMEREARGKNRDRVMKLLKDTHKYSDCPDTLLETK